MPLEVLIALKKRRLSRDLMRRENVTEDEVHDDTFFFTHCSITFVHCVMVLPASLLL